MRNRHQNRHQGSLCPSAGSQPLDFSGAPGGDRNRDPQLRRRVKNAQFTGPEAPLTQPATNQTIGITACCAIPADRHRNRHRFLAVFTVPTCLILAAGSSPAQ